MRIKDGYILRQFLDKWVAVDVHTQPDRPGMITMNKTGAFLWQQLQQERSEEELVRLMLDEYDVTAERAAEDVAAFIEQLRKADLLV